MKRSGELRNGRDLVRYHLSARTYLPVPKNGRTRMEGRFQRGRRKPIDSSRGNWPWESDVHPKIPNGCAQGKSMKRTTTLSRRYSHQEHRFEREMLERGLGQRLKRRPGQGSENGREAPRRNEGTNLGILKEECTEKSGQMDRGRHRRAVWESPMNRRDSGAITLYSCKGFLLVKKITVREA